MTSGEINYKIAQLNNSILEMQKEIQIAEKNVRQLTSLQSKCNEYQSEFETNKRNRKLKFSNYITVSGQSRFMEVYGFILEKFLDGEEYANVISSINIAKAEILYEMSKQQQNINQYYRKISDYNSQIRYLKNEMANIGE